MTIKQTTQLYCSIFTSLRAFVCFFYETLYLITGLWKKNANCNGPNFHNTGLSAGELIAIIHSHGGAYYSHWVKRKARGCFLLVKRETERLLVVTLNLLNYVFIKGRRQKQAISQWRGLSHQEFLNEAYWCAKMSRLDYCGSHRSEKWGRREANSTN